MSLNTKVGTKDGLDRLHCVITIYIKITQTIGLNIITLVNRSSII